MKGDLTRSTFDREKHYGSVRWQQGRVHVDADWNEEMDILAHRDRTTRRDVIGLCGGPAGMDAAGDPLAGFLVYEEDGELCISPGRYYVDGLLVENEEHVSLLDQPDLPPLPGNTMDDVLVASNLDISGDTYVAFLDVWERHITALEDPRIREIALGGPDTATRAQVAWQVKLMQAGDEGEVDCASDLTLWDTITAPSTGQLAAQAEPPEEEEGRPCIVPAQAGYRGLENQLYRVEVHRIVSENEITIKWSRENGSVVSAWLGQDPVNPNRLTVRSTGRDQVLGFAADDWIELTDDVRELRGQPGILVRIDNIEDDVLIIDPGGASVDFGDFPMNPKVRRWDMPSEVGEISVDLTVADNWIALEDGIQVKFEAGTLRTGDYWMIPARTASRDIEWPRDDSDLPLALLPHGIHHHYCRLALVKFDDGIWSVLSDCRRLFPPMTEMVRFFQVGGDGQEALPREFLPQPLQVAVSNGQWPVAGAEVAFNIIRGNGRLQAPDGTVETRIVVSTDAKGIAECRWRLDARTLSQRVEVTLLEIDGKPFVDADGNPQITPLYFNANLSVASQVAYDPRNCPGLSGAETVQQAIDVLCRRPQGGGCCVTVGKDGAFERLDEAIFALLEQGQRDICICLLAGDHVATSPSITMALEEQDLHISIHGCGRASRLILEDKTWFFQGVRSVTLRDLAIEPAFPVDNVEGAISFRHCPHVLIAGCFISGFTPEGPLLSIVDSEQVRLRENVLDASHFESLAIPLEVFRRAEIRLLVELFELPAQGEFRQAAFRELAFKAARELAHESPEARKDMQDRILGALGDLELSAGELFSINELVRNLGGQVIEPANLFGLIMGIRRAAVKTRPGLALVLGEWVRAEEGGPQERIAALDGDDLVVLDSNEIAGIVSLYGLPAPADFVREVLPEEFLKFLGRQLAERMFGLRGTLGTLNARGNQLVRITVTTEVIEGIRELSGTVGGPAETPVSLSGLFGRCLLSDNVFEGGENLIVDQHLAMTANDFTMTASPRSLGEIGAAIADSSIYTGNHSTSANLVLRNASRASARAANLDITIT